MAQQALSYNNSNALRPSGLTQPALLEVKNATLMRPAIGGKRRSKKSRKSRRGGYYPAVMGPLAQSGQYLLGSAIINGYKVLHRKNKKTKKSMMRR